MFEFFAKHFDTDGSCRAGTAAIGAMHTVGCMSYQTRLSSAPTWRFPFVLAGSFFAAAMYHFRAFSGCSSRSSWPAESGTWSSRSFSGSPSIDCQA